MSWGSLLSQLQEPFCQFFLPCAAPSLAAGVEKHTREWGEERTALVGGVPLFPHSGPDTRTLGFVLSHRWAVGPWAGTVMAPDSPWGPPGPEVQGQGCFFLAHGPWETPVWGLHICVVNGQALSGNAIPGVHEQTSGSCRITMAASPRVQEVRKPALTRATLSVLLNPISWVQGQLLEPSFLTAAAQRTSPQAPQPTWIKSLLEMRSPGKSCLREQGGHICCQSCGAQVQATVTSAPQLLDAAQGAGCPMTPPF